MPDFKGSCLSLLKLSLSTIILGLLLAAVSLSADALGICNGTGIGMKQILGAVVGILIALWVGRLGWGKT